MQAYGDMMGDIYAQRMIIHHLDTELLTGNMTRDRVWGTLENSKDNVLQYIVRLAPQTIVAEIAQLILEDRDDWEEHR